MRAVGYILAGTLILQGDWLAGGLVAVITNMFAGVKV